MLRLTVLLLILLNGVYFAWSEGVLRGLGYGPAPQTEPHRLAQQIKPELLRVLSPEEMQPLELAARPAAKPPECLQTGLLTATVSAKLRAALEASSWPADAWRLEPVTVPERWIIYMGKFQNAELQARKRGELLALNVKLQPLSLASLQPGLSLGAFETQSAAQNGLKELIARGVKTAKVVQERPEERGDSLRLPAVDDALRAQLDDIKMLLAGEPLRACRP